MAGLADLDTNARGELRGQAELRTKHAEYQRIAATDQLDAAAHANAHHFQALHFLVIGLDAPHDGANARRERIQTNQFFWSMVNCCHSLCKISFPGAMSNSWLLQVDVLFPVPALLGRLRARRDTL